MGCSYLGCNGDRHDTQDELADQDQDYRPIDKKDLNMNIEHMKSDLAIEEVFSDQSSDDVKRQKLKNKGKALNKFLGINLKDVKIE